MSKILTGLVATVMAAFAGSALAADIPLKAPAPVAPTLINTWNGWYVGLNAGYSWGRSSVDYVQGSSDFFGVANPGDSLALSTKLSPQSFIGGGQVGFNYQTGAWVWGAEADIAWRDHEDSKSLILNSFSDTLTLSSNQRWVGTVRAECLDWTLVWNGRQLYRVLIEYLQHYNTVRPHRSLDLQPPRPTRLTLVEPGGRKPPVQRVDVLGG